MDRKEQMIQVQLKGRDIDDENVLAAMRSIDRELFVPDEVKELAYNDSALPIGHDQTISQPYIVAYMAQVLGFEQDDRVLEVGSGCGYNAAVISRMASEVYSVEIIEWLAETAKENIAKTGIKNVFVKYDDGYNGWPERAPFDKIILTAAAPHVPDALKEQLKPGGMLLAPVADTYQKLMLLVKTGENTFATEELIQVRFVPLTQGKK